MSDDPTVFLALFGSSSNAVGYRDDEVRQGEVPSDITGLYTMLDLAREPGDPEIEFEYRWDDGHLDEQARVKVARIGARIPIGEHEFLARTFIEVDDSRYHNDFSGKDCRHPPLGRYAQALTDAITRTRLEPPAPLAPRAVPAAGYRPRRRQARITVRNADNLLCQASVKRRRAIRMVAAGQGRPPRADVGEQRQLAELLAGSRDLDGDYDSTVELARYLGAQRALAGQPPTSTP